MNEKFCPLMKTACKKKECGFYGNFQCEIAEIYELNSNAIDLYNKLDEMTDVLKEIEKHM